MKKSISRRKICVRERKIDWKMKNLIKIDLATQILCARAKNWSRVTKKRFSRRKDTSFNQKIVFEAKKVIQTSKNESRDPKSWSCNEKINFRFKFLVLHTKKWIVGRKNRCSTQIFSVTHKKMSHRTKKFVLWPKKLMFDSNF